MQAGEFVVTVSDEGRPGAAELRNLLTRFRQLAGRVLSLNELESLAAMANLSHVAGPYSDIEDRTGAIVVWGQASDALWREVGRAVQHVCQDSFEGTLAPPLPQRLAPEISLWIARRDSEECEVTDAEE